CSSKPSVAWWSLASTADGRNAGRGGDPGLLGFEGAGEAYAAGRALRSGGSMGTPPPRTGALKHLGRVIRQARTFAAPQRHVRAVGPVLEPVHGVGQARGGFGQVGRVDLFDVAQADDLGAGAGAGDQGLH